MGQIGRLEEGAAVVTPARIFDTSSMATALGRGYLLAGRLDEAAEQARRTLELASRNGFRGNEARALSLLGEVLTCCVPQDVSAAESFFRQALSRAEKLGMRPIIAHCHLGLARLFQVLGDRSKSGRHLDQALAMYQQMGMDAWRERVLDSESGMAR